MAIITLTALVFTLFSCKKEEDGCFLGSLDAPARMLLSGERYGVSFSAEIETGDGESKLTFVSPDSMAGICVTCAGGVWNSTLDGVRIAGVSAEMLGAPLVPFIGIGTAITAKRITDENGVALTLIVTEVGNSRFEYYVDSNSGIPLRVVEKNAAEETVMSFEVSGYKTISKG